MVARRHRPPASEGTDPSRPDREAQERLADWRAADRVESGAEAGSVEQRRAVATSRRARWQFEDAARAAHDDQGSAPETGSARNARAVGRMAEAANAAGALHPNPHREAVTPETVAQRDKRVADDAEIERELSD